jgi:hypothetical protein
MIFMNVCRRCQSVIAVTSLSHNHIILAKNYVLLHHVVSRELMSGSFWILIQLYVLFILEYELDCLHVSTITVTFREAHANGKMQFASHKI